jgi:hypothetical protein
MSACALTGEHSSRFLDPSVGTHHMSQCVPRGLASECEQARYRWDTGKEEQGPLLPRGGGGERAGKGGDEEEGEGEGEAGQAKEGARGGGGGGGLGGEEEKNGEEGREREVGRRMWRSRNNSYTAQRANDETRKRERQP